MPLDLDLCPFCNSSELGRGRAYPDPELIRPEGRPDPLPYPWSGAATSISDTALVGLFGPPGSGKTALASVLDPDFWLTTEQTVTKAARSMAWAQGGRLRVRPLIARVQGAEELATALTGFLGPGTLVLDSVTRVGGLRAQTEALELIEEWVQEAPGRRAIAILQVNSAGEPAGLTENEHLTTAILGVDIEANGLRRLFARKNREGGLGSSYFALTDRGVEAPEFDYSYSVEGNAGRYRLHPFPTRGAKYAGLLQDFFASKDLRGGLASAGDVAFGYPHNRVEPQDVTRRREFAEAHGLEWLDHTPQRPET